MNVYWDSILRLCDYAATYEMLKLARTMLLSTFLMCLVLIVRKCWELCRRGKSTAAELYGRAYLWLVFLPVPFMGALKLSTEYFHWRNHLYIVLYECLSVHAVIARLYFSGMAVVAAVRFIRKRKLRAWVRKLPVCEKLPHMSGKKLARVQVRTTPLCITPFTTGIFRHTVVLPQYILQEFDEAEIQMVLQHEYCHIRRGHLFVYAVLELFQVLWYVNPLVHLCARQVKNDLERICDHEVIQANQYDPGEYGMVLLKSVLCLQSGQGRQGRSGETYARDTEKGAPAFIREQSFRVMKKRMESISGYREYPGWQQKVLYVAAVAVLVSLVFFVHAASYPAYTADENYALYSLDGKQRILAENEAFNRAVRKEDDGLRIDNRKVKNLLEHESICDGKEDYWIYYGGYIKMPGIGGGGDLLYYCAADAPEDATLLPYNKTDRFTELVEWIFKHM